MRRGLSLVTTLLVLMSLLLSGCSLFLVEDEADTCVPKSKLEELGIDVEQLLKEEAPAEEEVPASEPEAEAEAEAETEVEGEEPAAEEEAETEAEAEAEEPTEEVADEPVAEEEVASDMPIKEYTAGDLVQVKPKGASEDLTFTFSEPLDENGEWQTTEADAGEYVVSVTATNNVGSITKELKLVIISANQAPVLSELEDVTVNAGETVTLAPEASDADGDEVVITFEGFMTEASKETTKEDIGEHVVTVKATDSKLTVSQDVNVVVLKVNTPPVLADIDSVEVTEGDLVSVTATATDADEDPVTVSYSEPLDAEGAWQTQVGDAGTYTVTATATDGEAEDTKTFSVTVVAANTAPVIEMEDTVSVVVVAGGSATVTLEPSVTDADGDEVSVTYSGFMDAASKEVTDADEGEHTVTVTANDGQATVTKQVSVVVEVNTPPEFSFE